MWFSDKSFDFAYFCLNKSYFNMNNFTCWLAWFEKYDFLLQDRFIQSHKHKTTLTRAPKLAVIITYLYDGSTCSKCNVTIYKRYESFVKIIGLLRNWGCFSLWIFSLFTQEHISGIHTAFKFHSRSTLAKLMIIWLGTVRTLWSGSVNKSLLLRIMNVVHFPLNVTTGPLFKF